MDVVRSTYRSFMLQAARFLLSTSHRVFRPGWPHSHGSGSRLSLLPYLQLPLNQRRPRTDMQQYNVSQPDISIRRQAGDGILGLLGANGHVENQTVRDLRFLALVYHSTWHSSRAKSGESRTPSPDAPSNSLVLLPVLPTPLRLQYVCESIDVSHTHSPIKWLSLIVMEYGHGM
ncbi:hypothetical protein N657DRAFT_235852 [Parathielavia appendiculata]|uniref:Uncharacterized protein n=1 Tax=Parathielavia appendiculata TaxID=2587402 RepID=A0AAN6U801_9PEZI|nr:hypothetical protein N657DRAFT_235852 [Parathielavia appendiculata]